MCYVANQHNFDAHVVVHLLFKGPVGDSYVCHSCANPACVNPDHLLLGSHQHNRRNAPARGHEFNLPRPIYDELLRRQALTGVYWTRIATDLLTESLGGGLQPKRITSDVRPKKRVNFGTIICLAELHH